MMDDLNQFIANLEDAIEDLESGSLTGDTDFKRLPQWDSLALLSTIAMVDYEYDVSMKADELKACSSVADLFKHIQSKKG